MSKDEPNVTATWMRPMTNTNLTNLIDGNAKATGEYKRHVDNTVRELRSMLREAEEEQERVNEMATKANVMRTVNKYQPGGMAAELGMELYATNPTNIKNWVDAKRLNLEEYYEARELAKTANKKLMEVVWAAIAAEEKAKNKS